MQSWSFIDNSAVYNFIPTLNLPAACFFVFHYRPLLPLLFCFHYLPSQFNNRFLPLSLLTVIILFSFAILFFITPFSRFLIPPLPYTSFIPLPLALLSPSLRFFSLSFSFHTLCLSIFLLRSLLPNFLPPLHFPRQFVSSDLPSPHPMLSINSIKARRASLHKPMLA